MTDTHKENGTEQLVGEKYRTNIIEFPIQIKMQDSESDTSGETFKVPSEEIQYTLNDPIWDNRWI